jgi:O-antigen/teichoic acid export membrane protein
VTDSGRGDQPATGRDGHGRPELRPLVVSGLRWKGVSQILLQVFSFASTLILARLLTPRDFGLAGLAIVFAGLAFIFADLGLGASIVQRKQLTEEDRSTAFWSNAGLGLALTLVGIGLSWPLADLYHQPEVQPLFAVISVTFLLTALGATQGALLIRNLAFRSLELRTLISTVTALAVGISAAALGYGAWAIIAQNVTIAAVSTLLLWHASPWRPHFVYSSESLQHLLGYGSSIFGSNLVRYLERNVDNFLVGRYRGPAALGSYSIAYNIMLIPFVRLVTPVQQVFFPALSRLQQTGELAAIWLRMTRVVTAITVPALLGMVVVAPEFVVVILGEKWRAAIPVLQILAWVGIVLIVSSQATTLLQAVGRAGVVFRYSIVSAITSIAGFAIGLHWGIVGVAAGYAIAKTLLTPFYVARGGRTIGVSLVDVGRALSGVAQAAAAMTLVVFGLRLALLDILPPGPMLVLLVVVGVAVYLPVCMWRVPEVAREIRQVRASRRSGPEAPGGLHSQVGS